MTKPCAICARVANNPALPKHHADNKAVVVGKFRVHRACLVILLNVDISEQPARARLAKLLAAFQTFLDTAQPSGDDGEAILAWNDASAAIAEAKGVPTPPPWEHDEPQWVQEQVEAARARRGTR